MSSPPHRVDYSPIIDCPTITPKRAGGFLGWLRTSSIMSICQRTMGVATYGRACPTPMSSSTRTATTAVAAASGAWSKRWMPIRCCVPLNLAVLKHYPEIAEAMVKHDWDFMSHGIYNTHYLNTYTEEQERAFYRDCIETP